MTEIMPVPRNLSFTVLPAGSLCRPLFLCSRQKRIVKRGNRFFRGAWEKRRLLCSASREKKGACVNSCHTRSQIEDNHQRATGRVDVPRPRTTSAIRIEQQRLFCSCRTAGQTAPQRGSDIKTQMRLNKIKILFNRVEARLDFSQNCGIMSVQQSAQLSGGLDSLFRVSI